MRFPVVLFDLDGTLIDSGPMILASFRHATSTVLGREIPDAELAARVGGSSLLEQMQALDPERTDELVDVYRAHNGTLYGELQLCPGIADVLEELRAEGRRLGIVSAKRQPTIALAFDALPLRRYFETVIGSDDVERGKPDPEGLLLALDRLGARPGDAAYVGDSPFDIGAAKAAGIHAVAVTWGGIHHRDVLAAEGPDAIVGSADQLRSVL